MKLFKPAVVILGITICIAFRVNPGIALISGFVVAGLMSNFAAVPAIGVISKLLLAWAIVALGATVNLATIYKLTCDYFFETASSIAITIIAAWYLGKRFNINTSISALIGAGTAICGASAIASVGGAIKANAEQMSMALGVVLILNAAALLIFPELGHLLGLTGHDFAVWSGLAIHDTSSVVAAAMGYDTNSTDVATTVKLARAIWIAPLTIMFAKLLGDKTEHAKLKLPWFIWGYLVTASIASLIAIPAEIVSLITTSARIVFAVGLFLTGCAVNIRSLRSLGFKPMILGLVLWILSASWSLLLISN